MKNAIKFLIPLLFAVFAFTSCSKDDDPVDNDLFVGTYRGSISYTFDGDIKRVDNGSVRVVKISGDTYSFNFSDGIPSLNNIKMEKGENNTIFFNSDAIGSITISESRLSMTYLTDGKTWTADTNR